MANLDFGITDPTSEWYSPAFQSGLHEGGFEHAAKEGRTDQLNQFDRYRTLNLGVPGDPESAYSLTYIPKVPPWFFGKLTDQLYGSSDPNILPLNSFRDPNYAYSQFARNERLASSAEDNWKMLSNMPDSPEHSEHTRRLIRSGIEELGKRFHRYSDMAQEYRQESMDLQTAYNRQIGINNLRRYDPQANAEAEIVEQDSRDFSMIDRGIGSGRIPPTTANIALREAARLRLEESMGNWDAELKGRGFAGPKGPYLLSGFPGQILDEISEKGIKDIKINAENVKAFQGRYMKDANFRTSVNQGLKAKVPGILAAGLGTAMVTDKVNKGASIPRAIGQTAAEIAEGVAKFQLMERFVGPVSELGAPERDPYAGMRQDPAFGMSPAQREARMNNSKHIEEVANMPILPSVKRDISRQIRERFEESKAVEANIVNSPLWNKQK